MCQLFVRHTVFMEFKKSLILREEHELRFCEIRDRIFYLCFLNQYFQYLKLYSVERWDY
jgi:hypothetical protein